MNTFGAPTFSLMNVLGQYQAIAGMNNANAAIMKTNQNQLGAMNNLAPLSADTVAFGHLAQMDKQNAMTKAQNEVKHKYYQAWLESLQKAKKQ